MRYGPDHKARSRERILSAAARQIKGKGPRGLAVNEVMAAAGLTHGAFYAHFKSKDGLIAEAVSAMFKHARDRSGGLTMVLAQEGDAVRPALRGYLEGYLSPRHRDEPERGCPLPSLAGDIARAPSETRENFAAGIAQITKGFEAVLAKIGRPRPDAEALAVVAQMVGAVGLARAAGPGPQSDAILRDCLDALIAKLDL